LAQKLVARFSRGWSSLRVKPLSADGHLLRSPSDWQLAIRRILVGKTMTAISLVVVGLMGAVYW
jgi:hypothetical protein